MTWAWLALAFLAGLAVYCLVWRPAGSLGLLLTVFGIDQLAAAVFPELAQQSWLVNVAVGSLIAVAWIRVSLRDSRPFGPPPYHVQALLSIYVVYFMISMVGWSGYEAEPREAGIQLLYLAMSLALGPALIRSHRDLEAAFWVGFLSAFVTTVTILANPAWRGSEGRLYLALEAMYGEATGTNPLALADVGVLAAVCALFLRPRIRAWTGLRWGAVAVGFWMALQASRGEPAAAVAAVLLVLFWARGGSEWYQRIGVTVGVIVLLVAFSVRLRDTAVGVRWERPVLEKSVEDRVGLSRDLANVFYESPQAWLTGLGGNYSFVDPNLGFYPHVHVVQALCETGIVGLALWIAAGVLTLRNALRLAREPASRAHGAVRVLLVLTVYAFLLTFKRGHVVDSNYFLLAVCTERLVVLSLDRYRKRRRDDTAVAVARGRARKTVWRYRE